VIVEEVATGEGSLADNRVCYYLDEIKDFYEKEEDDLCKEM